MNKPRLAKVARVRGEFALLVFRDAAADGVIDRHEMRAIEAALHDTVSQIRAVDASDAISRAIGRADDPRHLATLLSAYEAACDERTELVAG